MACPEYFHRGGANVTLRKPPLAFQNSAMAPIIAYANYVVCVAVKASRVYKSTPWCGSKSTPTSHSALEEFYVVKSVEALCMQCYCRRLFVAITHAATRHRTIFLFF